MTYVYLPFSVDSAIRLSISEVTLHASRSHGPDHLACLLIVTTLAYCLKEGFPIPKAFLPTLPVPLTP